jgi:hypothetical protein
LDERSNQRLRRRVGWRLSGCILLIYLVTAGGSLATTDAVATYELTRSLLGGSLAIPAGITGAEQAHVGVDGRLYSPFGIGQSIYNIPFFVAGATVERAVGLRLGKPDTITKAAVALGGTVAAALSVWVTFVFACRLGGGIRDAVVAAALLGLGTSLWPYAKFGFNAPLTMAALTGGTYAVWCGTREGSSRALFGSGFLLGAALLTRHEMALAVVAVAAFVLIETRGDRQRLWRLGWRVGVGFGSSVVVWLFYNVVRFGHPLDAGYLRDPIPAFGSSLAAGLYGLIASPGGSLFLYSPPAVVGAVALVSLWRRDRPTAVLFSAQLVSFVLFYALLGNWIAGRSYGPRYLVPLLPALCIPVAGWIESSQMRRRTALAVLALGLLVQLPGVLVDFAKVGVAHARRAGPTIEDRRYSWDAAPLVLNTKAVLVAVPENAAYLLGTRRPPDVRARGDSADRDFSQQFAFSLDFWWMYLFYMGAVPAPGAIALAFVPGAAALWLARSIARAGLLPPCP